MKKYMNKSIASTPRDAQRYEAEDASLSGSAIIGNSQPGYSGTGYVNIQDDGNISFTMTVTESGFYDINICYAGIFGEKRQNLVVNGQVQAEIYFPASTTFLLKNGIKKTRLNAGNNTVEIQNSWGWMLVDYIEIDEYSDITFDIAPELVNENATVQAKSLYEFLKSNFQQKTLSGVMTLDSMVEPEWLYAQTGKYPVILGLDFMHNVGKGTEWFVNDPDRVHQVANDSVRYYLRNGVPTITWHWRDPSKQTDAFYTADTDFNVNKIFDTGSAEYLSMMADIDVIASELKLISDNNVPILWRPLHEASGKWFWWGAQGPDACKELWHTMYNRLVTVHGLNNLIWVWTAEADDDAIGWYPGDDVVDIIGIDIYPEPGDHGSQVSAFEKLKQVFNGRKILALTECGSIPDPDAMVADGASWSWFMCWYGEYTIPGEGTAHNSIEFWNLVMNHSFVLTLDEMPGWKG